VENVYFVDIFVIENDSFFVLKYHIKIDLISGLSFFFLFEKNISCKNNTVEILLRFSLNPQWKQAIKKYFWIMKQNKKCNNSETNI